MVSMKEILYGSNDKEPHTETVAQLAQELYTSGLLVSLVENLPLIDFEVIPQGLLMLTFDLSHLGVHHCSPPCACVCVFVFAGCRGRRTCARSSTTS